MESCKNNEHTIDDSNYLYIPENETQLNHFAQIRPKIGYISVTHAVFFQVMTIRFFHLY